MTLCRCINSESSHNFNLYSDKALKAIIKTFLSNIKSRKYKLFWHNFIKIRVISRGLYHFLEVIFDFDFDPLVYRKTVWKASSKNKLQTSTTNFEHSLQRRGICMTSVKLAADSSISCWGLLHRPVLDAELNSTSNKYPLSILLKRCTLIKVEDTLKKCVPTSTHYAYFWEDPHW